MCVFIETKYHEYFTEGVYLHLRLRRLKNVRKVAIVASVAHRSTSRRRRKRPQKRSVTKTYRFEDRLFIAAKVINKSDV